VPITLFKPMTETRAGHMNVPGFKSRREIITQEPMNARRGLQIEFEGHRNVWPIVEGRPNK
jgi:hypothetical protein